MPNLPTQKEKVQWEILKPRKKRLKCTKFSKFDLLRNFLKRIFELTKDLLIFCLVQNFLWMDKNSIKKTNILLVNF